MTLNNEVLKVDFLGSISGDDDSNKKAEWLFFEGIVPLEKSFD